jgi:hypothetical protein
LPGERGWHLRALHRRLEPLKITAARLEASSAVEPNEFRDGFIRAIPHDGDG